MCDNSPAYYSNYKMALVTPVEKNEFTTFIITSIVIISILIVIIFIAVTIFKKATQYSSVSAYSLLYKIFKTQFFTTFNNIKNTII